MALNDVKFALVQPLVIDDTKFNDTLNDLPEPALNIAPNNDPALWVSGTAYVAGQRVRYNHKIFQCTSPYSGVQNPEMRVGLEFVFVSYVNRWKMFDQSNSTKTLVKGNPGASTSTSFYVFLAAGETADTVVFDNIVADVVRLTCYTSGIGSVVYDATVLLSPRAAGDWWDYFFRPAARRTSAVFQNIPSTPGMVLAFTITNNVPGQNTEIGTLVIGSSFVLGDAQHGARAGILDYSTKTTDNFGSVQVTERGYSKRMSVPVRMSAVNLDTAVQTLAKYRATPAMWLGTGNQYTAFLMYGYYRRFEFTLPSYNIAVCNFDIEGLT